jgi:hypothetical protein
MGYAYAQLDFLQIQLSERLGDPNFIFWTAPELTLCIREALRYWNSATMAWKTRFTFNTVEFQFWYDLTQAAGTPIPFTVTDYEVFTFLLYNLIEPQLSNGNYVGTDMFVPDDFEGAFQRRRDQFLLETGMVTGQSTIALPPPPENRVSLADTVMDVKRVAFIDNTGVYTTLWRSDEWAAQAFQNNWNLTQQTPNGFSVAAVAPITLSLIPPPALHGTAELVTVSSGANLDPLAGGILLGVPDDFSWVIRMGVLADLLNKDGQARDAKRAEYAQARWKEGIALAKIFNSVVNGYINGVQVTPQPVRSLSTYNAGWQNQAPGVPTALGIMSWNLIAVAPQPNSGPNSLMFDLVQNAPVPSQQTDFVQVGREDLDAILDYAQHLASFKSGGDEFMDTMPLYQNTVERAKARNARLRIEIPFYDPLSDRATRQAAEADQGEVQKASV